MSQSVTCLQIKTQSGLHINPWQPVCLNREIIGNLTQEAGIPAVSKQGKRLVWERQAVGVHLTDRLETLLVELVLWLMDNIPVFLSPCV